METLPTDSLAVCLRLAPQARFHFHVRVNNHRYCELIVELKHRLLLLKLDKQIGGTIYRPTLAANEACHMEGVGCPVGGGGFHVGGGGVQ